MNILMLLNTGITPNTTSHHLLAAVLEQLLSEGHKVHVVQMSGDTGIQSINNFYGRVSVDYIQTRTINKTNFAGRYIAAMWNYLLCIPAIKKCSDYDAVFIQSTNVSFLPILLCKKIIKNGFVTYNVQDIFPDNMVYCGKLKKHSILYNFLTTTRRYGFLKTDRIITVSEDMKETLVDSGISEAVIKVIYNWSYQDELYDNIDLAQVKHLFNPRYFNVVYAGNIGVMQNVDIVVEAARLMKDDKTIWFNIIGNGVYKDKLEIRAKEYGISNISFYPMQPSELAPAIYSAADVNVIPLMKNVYKTALPSKTATCFACQKPIIFAIGEESRFGQVVLKDTGCPVIDSDNADALVKAIQSVKNGDIICKTGDFFKTKMQYSLNSKEYVEIITRKQ